MRKLSEFLSSYTKPDLTFIGREFIAEHAPEYSDAFSSMSWSSSWVYDGAANCRLQLGHAELGSARPCANLEGLFRSAMAKMTLAEGQRIELRQSFGSYVCVLRTELPEKVFLLPSPFWTQGQEEICALLMFRGEAEEAMKAFAAEAAGILSK